MSVYDYRTSHFGLEDVIYDYRTSHFGLEDVITPKDAKTHQVKWDKTHPMKVMSAVCALKGLQWPNESIEVAA
jgi:hypothetical protein